MRKYQPGESTPAPSSSARMYGHRLILKLIVNIAGTYSKCDPKYTCKYGNVARRVLTEPSEGLHNDGHDNVLNDYIFYMYDEIRNERKEEEYVVEELIGKGTFGQVLLCRNQGDRVAVKVVRNRPAYQSQAVIEFQILKEINKAQSKLIKHPSQSRIVKLLDAFVWRKHLCLVFEYLENTLYDALKQSQFEGLHFPWIKQWATQILEGLITFHDMGIIHCDLKPENIMFVKDSKRPNSRLKIIDFGSSCYNNQTVYSYIQSRFYRAPEVILGAHYSNKIDMWSFGCILVELYLGLPIFPGNCMYDQLRKIVNILGVPPDKVLKTGKEAHKYFVVEEEVHRFKNEAEYVKDSQEKLPASKNYYKLRKLEELTNSKMLQSEEEFRQHNLFIEFIKGCLEIDPDKRFSAREAYSHRFIQEALTLAKLNEP